MGLDMILTRRKTEEEPRKTAYSWRKAFGILNWLNQNLESVKKERERWNGTEESVLSWDGKPGIHYGAFYVVKKEELERLLSICKQVQELKDDRIKHYTGQTVPGVPEDLLPVGQDWFIGSYEGITDWWWEDISNVIWDIPDVLKKIDWDNEIVEFFIT